MRLCACFDTALDVIEPCGFPLDDRRIRQGALDYQQWLKLDRHRSFDHFMSQIIRPPRRLVLLSTKADSPYHRFSFQADDVLLLGQESCGVPDAIHACADARVTIPMAPHARSLNLAMAGAVVLGEALRQLGALDR